MASNGINNHQGRIHGNILERVLHENSGLPPTPGISKHLSLTLESDAVSAQQIAAAAAAAQELSVKQSSFCFTRVVKSKINFQMLPYKLFYLFTDGAMACVVPYRSLFFKQLGLSASRIGIISASKPFASFVANPLAGVLADRFGKRRLILVISTLVWISLMVILGFVPPPKEKCLPEFSCLKDSKVAISKRSSKQYLSKSKSELDEKLSRIRSFDNLSGYSMPIRESQNLKSYLHFFTRQKRDDLRFVSESSGVVNTENRTNVSTTPANRLEKETTVANRLKNEECLIADQSWRYDPESINATFITILIITCFTYCAFGPAMRLADTSTLNTLSESKVKDITDYGWHRSFGGLGWAVCSLVVGSILYTTNTEAIICGVPLVITDYRIAFLMFGAVAMLAFICSFWMDFGKVASHKWNTQWTELRRLFGNIRNASILAVAFFVGLCNGCTWGFLLWHLQNLGASQFLIGLLEALQSSSELVIGFFCHSILQKFGHVNVLCVGLLLYAIRFACYALIENPYWMIPVEIAHGVSFLMTWTTLVSYLASAVSREGLATAQGVLGAVYFGLGNGLGSFASGLLIEKYGAMTTFSSFSVACAVTLVVFFFIQQICPNNGTDQKSPTVRVKDTVHGNGEIETIDRTTGHTSLRGHLASDADTEAGETSVFLPMSEGHVVDHHVTLEDISKGAGDTASLADSGVDSLKQRTNNDKNGPFPPIPTIPGSPRIPGPKTWLYLPILQSKTTDV